MTAGARSRLLVYSTHSEPVLAFLGVCVAVSHWLHLVVGWKALWFGICRATGV